MIRYPLTHNSWNNEEIKGINEIINSNRYTYGPAVKKFEYKLAKYHRVKHCVLVNSGSSANLIAVASLFLKKKNPIKRNDQVVVPGVSWSTTYSPLQQFDLKLNVVDINLDTLNIDENLVEKAINSKIKLLVAVNILGNPCNLEKLKKICNKNKIYLMEDNCESFGAKFNNRLCGTNGIVNTLSFYYSHHISTIEGGAVLTNDSEIYEILKSIRSHGWHRDINKTKKRENNREIYQFLYPGYNVRPTEFTGAIGVHQLDKVNINIKIRRENFYIYQTLFLNHPLFRIQKENGFSSSFSFVFIFRREHKNLRKKFFKLLHKNKIQFRLVTGGSFIKHPAKKFFKYKVYKNLKNSNYLHDYGFFLGNSNKKLKDKLMYFKKIVYEFMLKEGVL